ncbi:hypothetical protein C6497_01575 [Candidatus Poribacteria bacterium]|nr:MAG: hypothetical protein C6497_01575 [Candidatus Poribacteria bacterium]
MNSYERHELKDYENAKLRVPFAFDEERLCAPKTAEKGKHYFCPGCQDTVILKKGEVKAAHFAHKASKTCNQETIVHKTAKNLIVKMISDWKAGKTESPKLRRKCGFKFDFGLYGEKTCEETCDQPMPDKVEQAVTEYRMSNGFIADVALMVENEPALAIEIRVTHAVDENKAHSLSVPFIELDGHTVLEKPNHFDPIRDNKLNPFTCNTCKHAEPKFEDKVTKVVKQTRIKLPDRDSCYYRYGIDKCWNCQREIILYTWPGDDWDTSPPKKKPIPQTIKFCYSRTIGHKYWANTCPCCKRIQGDFFLYGSNLFPFSRNDMVDSPDAYRQDMQKIVFCARFNRMLEKTNPASTHCVK